MRAAPRHAPSYLTHASARALHRCQATCANDAAAEVLVQEREELQRERESSRERRAGDGAGRSSSEAGRAHAGDGGDMGCEGVEGLRPAAAGSRRVGGRSGSQPSLHLPSTCARPFCYPFRLSPRALTRARYGGAALGLPSRASSCPRSDPPTHAARAGRTDLLTTTFSPFAIDGRKKRGGEHSRERPSIGKQRIQGRRQRDARQASRFAAPVTGLAAPAAAGRSLRCAATRCG